MIELILKQSQEVIYQEKRYRIESPLSLDTVLLKNLTTNEKIPAKINALVPINASLKQNAHNLTTDLILISDMDWQEAKRREVILAPLANKPKCPLELAKKQRNNLIFPGGKFIIY